MGTYLAVRLFTVTGSHGRELFMVAAAASPSSDNGVKGTIIAGLFSVMVALIAAGALVFRSRGADVSDLLEVHERVAVVETIVHDIRHDLDTILRRLDP